MDGGENGRAVERTEGRWRAHRAELGVDAQLAHPAALLRRLRYVALLQRVPRPVRACPAQPGRTRAEGELA